MNRSDFFKFLLPLCVSFLFCTSCAEKAHRELAGEIAGNIWMDEVEKMAHEVVKGGFNAGDGYGEVWIRDYNTFIGLAMEVMPDEQIQDNLLTFFRFQGEGGDIVDGFIGTEKAREQEGGYAYRYSDLDQRYAAHKNTVETDQEASLIQAVWQYVRKSGNTAFLEQEIGGIKVIDRMGMALDYLMNERYDEHYGLLWGATTADWGDVQPEHPWGVALDEDSHLSIDIYDNAFFLIAIEKYLDLTDDPEQHRRWEAIHDRIHANVREHLWDEQHQKFIPHLYLKDSPFPADLDENRIYFHGGTAVAIEAGLLSRKEIKISNEKMRANAVESGAPSIGLTVYPPYPAGSFKNKGLYPYGYQNGGDWTWFGARMILQLLRNGFVREAYDEFQPMLERVVKNRGFYEWYALDGSPQGSGTFRGEAGVMYTVIREFRAWAAQYGYAETVSKYVEPRVGTAHCRWFHFAPGALPFGMAKPGPATNASLGNKSGWEATGYDYRDDSIEGFPCFHEFQVGGVALMPTVGQLQLTPGRPGTLGEGYRAAFTHKDEIVEPGYYSVLFRQEGMKAEVTATEHVAYQRFTFPEGSESRIIFNIGGRQGESGPVLDAEVQIPDAWTVEGWVETLPEYCRIYKDDKPAELRMYFSAKMDKAAHAFGVFNDEGLKAEAATITGKGAGAFLTYETEAGEQVTAQVGLSYTSVGNARKNRELETDGGLLPFDQVRTRSREVWEEHLSRIRVETEVYADKVKFYTGLYHALLGRGIVNDVNGAYPKHDGTIGQLPMTDGHPDFLYHNTDAFWGTQWNLVQLWALAYPERLSDFVSTHIQFYKDAGWLADGIACSKYVSGVGTNQIGNVISAAYHCGIRDFDIGNGYQAALKNELDGRNRPEGAGKTDTDQFLKYGYVPHDINEEYCFSASHTLEYSFGAYAVSELAAVIGSPEEYQRLRTLSHGWAALYNPENNFLQPRMENGEFIPDFNPIQVWRGFQEGNSYQYTFYVPHDVQGLIAKIGREEFVDRLDKIFTASEKLIFSGGRTIDAFAGLETYYNQGNQPCLHISWLFNEAGRYDLTQKWVRSILDKFYGTDGIHGYGYGQDEDQGQLGAWYVISSLGLFDVKGLASRSPEFALGSPLFDKMTVRLNPDYYPGSEFVIETIGNAKDKYLVRDFRFNGQSLERPYLKFQDVVAGGKLEVEL